MRLKARALTIVVLATALFAAACGGDGGPVAQNGNGSSTGGGLAIRGAGATFPNPLYTKWIAEFNKKDAAVKIDYQAVGSGSGIKQITEKTVDFGASDAPMTDEQLAAAPGILHIPTVLGAVVITYNLADVKEPLKLDGTTAADIFSGTITKWDDAKIAALNPGVKLPANDIAVAYRAEGSGTTAIFTDYLAKVSPDFKTKVGAGTQVKWPKGQGQKGNDGVAGFVKSTPGAVGYVELIYAKNNNLPTAWLKNATGAFIEPTLDAVTAAAAGVVKSIPEDLRMSITNADGAQSYPISGFTYLLVYKDQADAAKGKAIADFVWWGLHDGGKFAKDLAYAPLPAEVLVKAEAKVKLINNGGKPFVS